MRSVVLQIIRLVMMKVVPLLPQSLRHS